MYPIFILSTLIVGSKCHDIQKINWVQHLSTYIPNKINPHQVVILKKSKLSGRTEDVISEIGIRTPTWTVEIDNPNANLLNFTLLRNPASTTLFIVIQENVWNSTLKRAFKFIENLSGARIRPRCLILHFDIKYLGGRIYEELLIELWQKKFPNVDILRIVKKNILNNLKLSLEENVTLHSYNDFTKKYLEEKFSLDTNMFPDKFQDLNGHQLLVGEDALFSKEHLNSHNSKSIIKIISKALNLSMKVRYKLEKDIWKPNPENKKIITRLENGEFDLLKFLRPMIGKAETDNYETTNFVESRELVAVVPILTRELHFLPVTQNFIFSMIFIISLLLLLLIIARLFRFDSEFSHPMNIMQLIYGLSTSCSLQKLQEKILFFFIFLAYILYSSSIFQEMTQIFIHSQEEIKFSNIEELNKTNLVPLFKSHREKSNAMAEAIDSDFFPFLNKSLKHANCLSILIEFKNVTCLYPKDQAEIEIYKQLSIYSDVRMKIVKENLLSSYRSLKLAPGSPLVAKFDEIILRILETGLKRVRDLRWSQKVKTATSIEDRRKEIEKCYMLTKCTACAKFEKNINRHLGKGSCLLRKVARNIPFQHCKNKVS